MKNYLDLKGKVALVTGASSGIGSATATVLADLGAAVGVGYFHNEKGATQVAQTIGKAGGKAVAVRADVSRAQEIPALVERVERELGPIDILVNNAGSLIKRQPMRDLTEELWDEVLDLNLKSAAFCARAVAAGMTERKRGTIVNVVSIAGRNGGGPGAGPRPSGDGPEAGKGKEDVIDAEFEVKK